MATECVTARCIVKFWKANAIPRSRFVLAAWMAPVAPQGKSSVKVHGLVNVHRTDHEITAPADVEMTADHWLATAHFTIPYVKWGMKNPSTFFLRVSDSVEIDVAAGGSRQGSVAHGSAQ